MIFIEELLMANEVLSETEFVDLAQKIQNGLEKSLDVFKKWMDQWRHLPFSICRLGGKCGPDFALAVANVVLDYPFPNEPTERVKKYMDELAFDLRNQKNESFGLFEALDENESRVQFLAFSQSTILEINKFPLVFDFVKNRIWLIIVHQQHLEGMFNRYDLKTNTSMSESLQIAIMQLSSPKPLNVQLTKEKLSSIHAERKQISEVRDNAPTNGENVAIKILERF